MSRRIWLLILTLGLVTAAFLLAFQLVIRMVEADQLFELEERLASSARTLAIALSEGMARGDIFQVENLISSHHEAEQTRIRILDEKRHVVADSYGAIRDPDWLQFRPEIQTAFLGRYGAYTRFADENDRSLALFVAVPVEYEGKIVGAIYLSRSTDSILQRLGILRKQFQGILSGLMVIILVGMLWLTRGFNRDLQRLDAASKLDGFEPEARDEVARVSQSLEFLVESLSNKVKELEEEQDKTRRFVEDVAHELKTPVTGLRGAVEAVKSQSPEHPLFRNIERETERLDRLTRSLLELRKLEYYTLKPRLFDLSSLIDSVLDSFRTSFGDRLQEELPDQCPVCADPNKITRVLENLVENALRCSPAESLVTITLESDPDFVSVTVSDRGPGISRDEAQRIFKRGERGTGPVGHLGLGLAVAAQIVELHQGQFLVDSDRSVGAAFTFRLPLNGLTNLDGVGKPSS